MSNSVADDQLRAFIERIERMEEEKKAVADDIKEIYAEAKGNGFDTKVLRQVIRIRKMDHAERMEQEAILELYMAALGMQYAPRADDREARRRQRVSEDMDDHKALMDEIGAAGLLRPEQVAENKRLADAVATKFGNGPITDHKPEPMVAQAGEADPGATSVQPQVRVGLSATKSTDASQKRAQTATGVGTGGDNLGPASRSSAPAKTDVPTDQSQASGDGQSQHNSGVRVAPVDTHPEPGSKGSGFVLGREVTASSPAPVIPFKHPDDGRPRSKEGLPRPVGCQRVDACATTWRATEPCTLCRKRAADQMTVEAGGAEIAHHGFVA